MHKNLFGIAAIFGSLGVLALGLAALLHAVPQSQAQDFGPVVTGGEQPWRSFTGEVPVNANVDLFTVPQDRSFVVTTACVRWVNSWNSHLVDLAEGGTGAVRVQGETFLLLCDDEDSTGTSFNTGRGHAVFEAGEIVRLTGSGIVTPVPYYVEGYLAAP